MSRPLVAAWWLSLLRRGVCIGLCAVACVVALSLHTERAAAAATYTVGSISDVGTAGTQAQCLDPNNTACRLRDAIGFAISGSDTIVFNSSGRGTITVGSTLTLAVSVTITGPTSGTGVTVQAAATPNSATYRVFVVNGGVTASIANLTIANGSTSNVGGGIDNNGTLTVTNSTLSGNSAVGIGIGGGIFNDGGTLTVTNSTLSGNSANNGDGGGIGILNGSTVNLTNTIVAGNTARTSPDIVGPVATTGHNLIGDRSGASGFGASDKTGIAQNPLNPLLGTLGAYGSTNGTQTFPLLPGSPAIDAIPAANHCGTGDSTVDIDQRGVARPQPAGGLCDIGAFESQGFTLAKTSGDTQSTPVTTTFTNPLVVTVAPSTAGAADSEPVNGGVVTFTGPGSGADIAPTRRPRRSARRRVDRRA